ncbi:sn-glycerol-3-phosphate ABC transporter ATP-binding protein UgpC [soil metagenome]
MASVHLDNVRKKYDNGHVAVHGASLSIDDGEFVVLVGPSGCGKSTTLRMIAGLEAITSGQLSIGGRVVNDVAPKDRDIAMVFQNYALYPHMTVFDNMAFGLQLRKYPKAEISERVEEAAATLGLTEVLDQRPKHLSGGQRQRVALGRAIVRKPQVFLFDEPLSNLDAKLRVQTRTEISRLHKRLAATMVYVTHDQVEAMTMGDRIVVMRDGHIMQIAPPLTLYNQPANRFVAGFIGSPSMNFLTGHVSRENDRWLFSAADLVTDIGYGSSNDDLQEGRDVVLGIRPEHLTVADDDDPDAFELSVDVIEPMGNEIILYARSVSGELIVARIMPQELPSAGEIVRLSITSGTVHLFDALSEEAIPLSYARSREVDLSEVQQSVL